MFNPLQKTLRIFIVTCAFSMTTPSLAVGLGDQVSQMLKDWLKEQGVIIDWSKVDLDMDSEGMTGVTLKASARNLGVRIPEAGLRLQIENLNLAASLKMGMDGFTVSRLGSVKALGVEIYLRPTKKQPVKNEPFLELPTLPDHIPLPGMLLQTRLGVIDIDLKKLVLTV